MPLPIGTWTANVAGGVGPLVITKADPSVTGTLFGKSLIGVWDETAQKLSFCINDPSVNLKELYTGFLFQDQFRMPGIIGGTVFTLVGPLTNILARPENRSWYAQIGLQ